jgi:NADPH-dependent curcumin reductase CurA
MTYFKLLEMTWDAISIELYFQTSVDEALKDGAPNGVDCFFDNVGGVDATIVINNHMNTFGRISGCGAISVYNNKEPEMIPSIQGSMVFKVGYYLKPLLTQKG